MEPESGQAYFWRGAITGRLAQEQGIMDSLSGLKKMRDDLEKAIEALEEYRD
ncbi:MAG: hypothetical protein ACOC5A_01705 [Halanaerobiales bacterium]